MCAEKVVVENKQARGCLKYFLIIVGLVSVGLGVIGIVVPLLPTTPFLLLAATCFARSSTRCHSWLFHNKWFGKYLKNYYEGRGIPIHVKVYTLLFLWVTILSSAFLFVQVLWVRVLLGSIASAVTIHILMVKTYHGKDKRKN